ncbi:MAG: molybdopterin converting factor subunit 1 [Alphaproteobacteria bacterium]
MKILYFAWLKNKIGKNSDELNMDFDSVNDLVNHLKSTGDNYKDAFNDINVIKVSINCEFAKLTDPVKSGDEVAFFPPITGG